MYIWNHVTLPTRLLDRGLPDIKYSSWAAPLGRRVNDPEHAASRLVIRNAVYEQIKKDLKDITLESI